jgi:arginine repressor
MIPAEVARNNDATAEELRELLRRRASVEVSQPTITRTLARLNLRRKKNSRSKRTQ